MVVDTNWFEESSSLGDAVDCKLFTFRSFVYFIGWLLGCIESFEISAASAGNDEVANVVATATVMEPRKSRLEQSSQFSFANR